MKPYPSLMQVFLQPVNGPEGVERWANPYRDIGDELDPVKLPDLWEPPGEDSSAMEASPRQRVAAYMMYQAWDTIAVQVPPTLQAGFYMPIVVSGQWGAAQYPANESFAEQVTVFVTARIDRVEPSSINAQGGQVTLWGTVFPTEPSGVVLRGYGVEWTILSRDSTRLVAFATGLWDTSEPFRLILHSGDGGSMATGGYSPAESASTVCTSPECHLTLNYSPDITVAAISSLNSSTSVVDLSTSADLHITLQGPDGATDGLTPEDVYRGVWVQLHGGPRASASNATILGASSVDVVISKAALDTLPASSSQGHRASVVIEGMGITPIYGYQAEFYLVVPISVSNISTVSGALSTLVYSSPDMTTSIARTALSQGPQMNVSVTPVAVKGPPACHWLEYSPASTQISNLSTAPTAWMLRAQDH